MPETEEPRAVIYDLDEILREATATVEDELRLEDAAWINLSAQQGLIIPDAQRILNLKQSRLYHAKDPLAHQAVRLWTDYTFGSGMTWQTEDDATKKVLEDFWGSKANQPVLSARGQRKSSDKLLVDGEVFFALFLGAEGEAKIRWIDPLEITEIITNPDDIDDVLFYRRAWTDRQGSQHTSVYRSTTNMKGTSTLDMAGQEVSYTDYALVYHLTYNTITQRGNPLLLPALDWLKQYRRFLASRVAIMLAIAKFAWKSKIKGGETAVNAIRDVMQDADVPAGSHLMENMGVETTPIKQDTGSRGAYQDARLIKLQICAAVGIPEQYFGDISIGNLATAKTVELPMMKMFQSYQKVWADTYQDIDEVVLEHSKIAEEKWYVDRAFPPIAPADMVAVAQALAAIIPQLPSLADSAEVKQAALMALGINDPGEVLDALTKEAKENPEVALIRVLRPIVEAIKERGNGSHE